MKDQREWIDIVDWTVILGTLSALPCAYFWFCMLAHGHGVRCPGPTVVVLLFVFLAIPSSAVAGAYGYRIWWFVTVVAVGTLLFVVLRLH